MVTPDHPDLGAYAPGQEVASLLDVATKSLADFFNGAIVENYSE